MELTVVERLVLGSILPQEGNFMTLRLMRKLKEDLSFDDLENKRLNFIQDGELIRWDNAEAEKISKNVEVGETMLALIVKELKQLDESNTLKEEQMTLFEKFIERPTPLTEVK